MELRNIECLQLLGRSQERWFQSKKKLKCMFHLQTVSLVSRFHQGTRGPYHTGVEQLVARDWSMAGVLRAKAGQTAKAKRNSEVCIVISGMHPKD